MQEKFPIPFSPLSSFSSDSDSDEGKNKAISQFTRSKAAQSTEQISEYYVGENVTHKLTDLTTELPKPLKPTKQLEQTTQSHLPLNIDIGDDTGDIRKQPYRRPSIKNNQEIPHEGFPGEEHDFETEWFAREKILTEKILPVRSPFCRGCTSESGYNTYDQISLVMCTAFSLLTNIFGLYILLPEEVARLPLIMNVSMLVILLSVFFSKEAIQKEEIVASFLSATITSVAADRFLNNIIEDKAAQFVAPISIAATLTMAGIFASKKFRECTGLGKEGYLGINAGLQRERYLRIKTDSESEENKKDEECGIILCPDSPDKKIYNC